MAMLCALNFQRRSLVVGGDSGNGYCLVGGGLICRHAPPPNNGVRPTQEQRG